MSCGAFLGSKRDKFQSFYLAVPCNGRKQNTDWTIRGGYAYGDQPIPETEVLFNILAPGVIQSHVALGFTKKMPKDQAIHFSFNYALNNKVEGFNPFDFDPELAQMGQLVPHQKVILEMNQIDVALQYTF